MVQRKMLKRRWNLEQKNWEYNIDLAQNILFGTDLNPVHINYGSKYYGIGFQIFSQPIQFILEDVIVKFQNIDNMEPI